MLAIEVNEIHTAVSRSFVRPRATSPSLPACLPFSVCCSSLWNIKEMKTLHILCMQQLPQKKKKKCKLQESELPWSSELPVTTSVCRMGYYCMDRIGNIFVLL